MDQKAIDTPVPMDDDVESEEKAEEEAKDISYGPVRKKDEKQSAVGGIVFQATEVEDVAIEAAEEDDDGAGSGGEGAPYAKPNFKPLTAKEQGVKKQLRRVPVPMNRLTPLKNSWMELIKPVVEHLKLQVRMNTKRRAVEIRSSSSTEDIGSLQKAADYFRAFMLGFDQADSIALLRLDDLFIESFEVKDVKRLEGDHLSRCIGRIAGKDGKTKYAIENSTRTRISLCEDKVHILGSFANIRLARDSICSLILGSAPGKVYTKLRTVSKRLQERI
mmetsp:Transcript_31102/g.70728  ORF Transcript_31102/g.70728 Transcript_31102/m.70728 type:complete len:275 (+) Transcript_31102:84-908(+)